MLAGSEVADADGPRATVAIKLLELTFGGAVIAKQRVQRREPWGGLVGRMHEPADECVRFRFEADAEERPDNETSVADPAEPIVVVALSADPFRKRCGGGGNDCSGGGVGKQFERERAPEDVIPVRAIVLDLRRPIAPEVESLLE